MIDWNSIETTITIHYAPVSDTPYSLNQMYSQQRRYGTPPIVHATDGLVDTVVDCTPETLANNSASGFLFDAMTAESLTRCSYVSR